MAKTSPTKRTLAMLRKLGMTAAITEHWNQFSRRRIDLFNFCDILALLPQGILFVQCTTSANQAARVTKITTECRQAALAALEAGGKIEVWGWSKRGPRGKRKLWDVTRREITVADFPAP